MEMGHRSPADSALQQEVNEPGLWVSAPDPSTDYESPFGAFQTVQDVP